MPECFRNRGLVKGAASGGRATYIGGHIYKKKVRKSDISIILKPNKLNYYE